MSSADFYVDTSDIFKNVKSDEEILDVDDEAEAFEKQGRKAVHYH